MLTPPDVSLWRSGFFVLQNVTCVHYRRWIDRDVSIVDVLNDSFFIDHEGSAISETLLFVEDAIVFDDSAFEITEYRESNSNLFCEFAVGGNAVDTHAENLGVGGIEFGDISLIRLQLLRSTTGERQYINRQYDVLLSFEIAELVNLSIGGAQRKIRGLVTNLQVCFGWRLLGQCDDAKHNKQQEGCEYSHVHNLISLPIHRME